MSIKRFRLEVQRCPELLKMPLTQNTLLEFSEFLDRFFNELDEITKTYEQNLDYINSCVGFDGYMVKDYSYAANNIESFPHALHEFLKLKLTKLKEFYNDNDDTTTSN